MRVNLTHNMIIAAIACKTGFNFYGRYKISNLVRHIDQGFFAYISPYKSLTKIHFGGFNPVRDPDVVRHANPRVEL